jgi:hypothetical protein
MDSTSSRLFNKFKYLPSSNLLTFLGAFLLFLATAAYYNIPSPEFLNTKFGWEYGNIAEALVQGKGFSNAFTPESGPTAWMPPLFVFLLAGVFKIFGVKSIASMWVVFLIKYIALAASMYLLLSNAKRVGYEKFKYLLALLFVLMIYFNRDAFFRSLHDEWLNLFLACWMLYAFSAQVTEPSKTNWVQLFLLATLLPLTNPALTLAFAITEGWVFLRARAGTSQRQWVSFGAIFALLAASTFVWTFRNYQVFDRLIPIKSNFWYDFYQANALDEDGLTTNETFAKYHPINKNEAQEKYLREGEVRFIDSYQALSRDWIRSHPSQLLTNIGRRVVSAFIYSHYVEDIPHMSQHMISTHDLEVLHQENLIFADELSIAYWISITLSDREFEQRIAHLPLDDKTAVLQDWSTQKVELEAHKRSWKIVLKSLSLSIIPSLSILGGLLIKKVRKNPAYVLALAMYLIYLLPYILVSYYRRYQVPMIGLQSVFMFLIINTFLERIFPKLFSRK